IKYFKCMENKKSLSTILFGVAMLLFVWATFAMFGKLYNYSGAPQIPNMFQVAFGTSGADGYRVSGMTAIFVFQMIIIAGIIAIIIGTVTNKFHYVLTIVLYCVVCLCSFIAFIISFNSLGLYSSAGRTLQPGTTLGAGPIAYSVLHILGLLASAGGLVLSRRGK
ncbi:MAG: hypothetical protein MJ199_01360, partial [Bacilli bacterium]|nr:hypothetical protein [Bacilli bacterium]